MTAVIAAAALFKVLGLEKPVDWRNPTPKNETVLIWGGSTSVGGYAIQLAVMVYLPTHPSTHLLTSSRLGIKSLLQHLRITTNTSAP